MNPRRSIPLAMMSSLLILLVLYILMAAGKPARIFYTACWIDWLIIYTKKFTRTFKAFVRTVCSKRSSEPFVQSVCSKRSSEPFVQSVRSKRSCWCSIAIVALTLAVPFEYIDTQAAFPQAFAFHGYPVAKNLASIGIALGMFGALVRLTLSVKTDKFRIVKSNFDQSMPRRGNKYSFSNFAFSHQPISPSAHQPYCMKLVHCIIPLFSVTFCIHSGIIPVGQFFPKMCKINQSSVDFHCKPL